MGNNFNMASQIKIKKLTTDRPHHVEHLQSSQNLAKPIGFGDICKKSLSGHYILCNTIVKLNAQNT